MSPWRWRVGERLVLTAPPGAVHLRVQPHGRGQGVLAPSLAINVDPDVPVFDWADIALVGDWRRHRPGYGGRHPRCYGTADHREHP